MTLVSAKQMVENALQEKYAVGHFNINNLEFAQAILVGAEEEQSPVILAVSPGYIPYLGGFEVASAMVKALVKELKITVPVALHLDHGSSFAMCLEAMKAGFTSVMIDASHFPLKKNIEITKQVVEAAQIFGVSVEAELGRIGGREDDLVVDEEDAFFAVPEECDLFVKETQIDFLAPALGSVHGIYKGKPNLNFNRMKEIQKLTGIPLVLHGGSGIPLHDIQTAISLGTSKINVNTENQISCTSAVRQFLANHPDSYDPRDYLGLARETVKAKVKEKLREFGCSGKVEKK
jgi:fructose-bisphosphate aldolase, class II